MEGYPGFCTVLFSLKEFGITSHSRKNSRRVFPRDPSHSLGADFAIAKSGIIPHAQSLKEKRSVLKSLKDRVRDQFNVAVAEVGDLDKWQLSTFALVNVGNDQREIDAALQHLLRFVETNFPVEITEHEISFI